jgi:hypothetical protein
MQFERVEGNLSPRESHLSLARMQCMNSLDYRTRLLYLYTDRFNMYVTLKNEDEAKQIEKAFQRNAEDVFQLQLPQYLTITHSTIDFGRSLFWFLAPETRRDEKAAKPFFQLLRYLVENCLFVPGYLFGDCDLNTDLLDGHITLNPFKNIFHYYVLSNVDQVRQYCLDVLHAYKAFERQEKKILFEVPLRYDASGQKCSYYHVEST